MLKTREFPVIRNKKIIATVIIPKNIQPTTLELKTIRDFVHKILKGIP